MARSLPYLVVACSMASALLLWSAEASPEAARPVEVGDVSAARSGAGPAALGALRRTLEGAARSMARSRRVRRPFVITGAVTRLEEERRGGRLHVLCEVSLVVLERPGGRMRALLTGRASTEGGLPRDRTELEGLQRGVVSSAAQSALDRLATVIGEL